MNTNTNNFQRWASEELARMETPTTDGGLYSTYAVDKMDALRRAIQDGDELRYDLSIAQLDGDGFRCEEISQRIEERDTRIIISRHPATVQFIKEHAPAFAEARVITGNATAEDVRGKYVAGNLPLHLASKAKQVLAVEFGGTPPRGAEYTLEDMKAADAYVNWYVVEVVK